MTLHRRLVTAAQALLGRSPETSEHSPARSGPAVAGPDTVEVSAKHLRLGDGYTATLAVTGYPAEVGAGWLEPLLCYPGRLDVALHIDPVPPAEAARRLRKQQGKLESSRRSTADAGRLADPELDAAAADAADMATALARSESKLFSVAIYLTVHAASREELDAEVEQVTSIAAGLLLETQPASFRQVQGWTSTLPLGVDQLAMRRSMDTPALAAAFPFTSADLPAVDPTPRARVSGRLYGANASSSGLVFWDRWAQDNYNSVTLARSGAGKSYLTKLEALRSLYPHPTADGQIEPPTQVFVIDPELEYQRLAHLVGGSYLRLGAAGVRINPFDLPNQTDGDADALTRRSLFAHTLTAVLLGQDLTPAERAVLDRATTATYHAKGITTDPRTWARPAPQLADLADALQADGDPNARDLAARLAPYVTGAYRGLFDGPTTHPIDSHLVAISLRDIPDELRAAGTLIALDAIRRQVAHTRRRRRRLVIVDEAWMLMTQEQAARFLYRFAKSSRKDWAALAFVSQDPEDVLSSDLGKAIIDNSATQVLLRQASQAIDTVADAFGLSDGERGWLLAGRPGDALLLSGTTTRVAFHALAAPAEHAAITTDPAELAAFANDPNGALEL